MTIENGAFPKFVIIEELGGVSRRDYRADIACASSAGECRFLGKPKPVKLLRSPLLTAPRLSGLPLLRPFVRSHLGKSNQSRRGISVFHCVPLSISGFRTADYAI